MNSKSTRLLLKRICAQAVLGAMLVQGVAPAYAVVSQNPALFVKPPDANVMFTLDDSLSMLSDAIPDFIADQAGMPNADGNSTPSDALSGQAGQQRARFPGMWKSDTLYWSTTYYRSDNAIARYMRSSAGNPLYYNPTVTYKPWPKASDDTQLNAPADPTKVNIDPSDPFNSSFIRNLTVRVNESGSATDPDNQANNFWPATYYVYKTTAPQPLQVANPSNANNVAANFTKVVVTGLSTDTTTYDRATTRTDCTGAFGAGNGGCTRVQELQNFANWLQYYRSRMLMAKGGVSAAFAQQLTNLRVGFGTINSAGTVRQGVATFSGARRTSFYTDLYSVPPSGGGTQLRRAMDQVGQYFTRSDAGNPWAENPTSSTVGTEYTCRKSFHILSTDGYWNGSGASGTRANDNDSFSGQTPAKPDGTTYTFSDTGSAADPLVGRFTINPFTDGGTAGTLADVAAYYWKTDLRSLANEVPSSTRDPAFWQHLSTYTVGLGVSGTGTVKRTSDNSTTVPLTEPATSPLYAYRGLPWLAKQELRDYLVANKVPLTWTTPASDAAETGDDLVHASMNGRGRYYSASDPTTLKNGLSAALAEAADSPASLANVVTESPQVSTSTEVYQATYNPSQWYGRVYAFSQSASGAVATTPSTAKWEASNKMPAPSARQIFTWNPLALPKASGSLFTWSGLNVTQQLNLGNDATLLDYLRGDPAKELQYGGPFRDRERYTVGTVTGGVLGDIVNGSPIKGPSAGGGYDRLPSTAPGQSTYSTFRSSAGTNLDNMRNTLFVGANDGMLHAFRLTDGVERFAFVPNSVFSVPRSLTGTEQKLKMLSDPGYAHRMTVDGPPQIGDAFIGPSLSASDWKTVLLGSTGAGARSIFAMDVTDPVVSATAFGASKILWEFSEANDAADMGYVTSYPHIARMRDGTWVAIFGNGYDSANGQAVLFILDLSSGTVIKKISVGTAGGNGLSQPNFTVDSNRLVTAIYAGDLKGSLWKFDVSSDNRSDWTAAFGGTPLFKGDIKQPITVMPELAYHPSDGWMVSFGTGKLFDVEDTATTLPTNVNLNTQALYGIWDKPGETSGLTDTSKLVLQTANSSLAAATDPSLKGTTRNTVDWSTKRGWYMNLASGGERVNVNPQQIKNVLLMVANTPNSDLCKAGGSSRLFALDPFTGMAPDFGVFDANASGGISTADKGYNVKSITYAVMSLPTLQSKKPVTDLVTTESQDSRGQTGARLGGVENKPINPTDCDRWLLAGGSDTSIVGFDISVCNKNKPRISWRQLK